MIGLDTNILLRFLNQDDPVQSEVVNRLFEDQLSDAEPGYISIVTLAETVWVLRTVYKLSPEEIIAAVTTLLQIKALRSQFEREVLLAVTDMRDKRGSFADVLIGLLNTAAGCTTTVSFDRKASRMDGYSLLG